MARFQPMLATEHEPDKLVFPLYASPKYDGIRALGMNLGGKVLPVSRSLKTIPNRYVQSLFDNEFMHGLDGELVVGDPCAHDCMQATTSGVMSEDGTPEFSYYVFDTWSNPVVPFKRRLELLTNYMWNNLPHPLLKHVKLVPQYYIENEVELTRYEEEHLAAGYEGIMVRGPDGIYKYGRSTVKQGYLLKVKRFADAEAVVVGFEEQMENTNELETDERGYAKRSTAKAGMVPKGTLGALVVKTISDNGLYPAGTEFRLGTGRGLTAAVRQHIWDNRQNFLGAIAKYRYQHVGSKDAPRIPIWIGWRDPSDM